MYTLRVIICVSPCLIHEPRLYLELSPEGCWRRRAVRFEYILPAAAGFVCWWWWRWRWRWRWCWLSVVNDSKRIQWDDVLTIHVYVRSANVRWIWLWDHHLEEWRISLCISVPDQKALIIIPDKTTSYTIRYPGPYTCNRLYLILYSSQMG